MAVDWSLEKAMTLTEAARHHKRSWRTVWNWIHRGVTCKFGFNVRLEAYRCGAKWNTSAQALHRFFERLEGRESVPTELTRDTPEQRERRLKRARKYLLSVGMNV